MKKMKICGIFLLCMLVAGCSTDIEQEVVDNSETEQESIETEAEQETERRDLYEEDEAEDEIIDFRLVEGSLYNKVNRNFEYEKEIVYGYLNFRTMIIGSQMQMEGGKFFRSIWGIMMVMEKKILFI